MNRVDGRQVSAAHEVDVDVVVVGSGPAGSAVARAVAGAGASVAVIEAGAWAQPEDFPVDAFSSLAMHYRELGTSLMFGSLPMPYLQGKMVGGSSPINGAICWRLPRDVFDEWVHDDPALGDALPWSEVDAAMDEVEAELGVSPTEDSVAGEKGRLMARGADALGLEHRPIRRNVRGCRGLGRCLQGCPEGNKLSVDRTLLRDAEQSGASVLSSVAVERLLLDKRGVTGVEGTADGGGRVQVRARRAVVLAASAVQTPGLLLANRIRHGPVGENFQCHPGVAVAGRFVDPVRMWEGATQGHEVIGLRKEGIKFETLGFGLSILASRLKGVGGPFAERLQSMAHWLMWGAAIRAEGKGRVRWSRGRASIRFSPTARDVERFGRATQVMGEMFFAAGAKEVTPGVHGWDEQVFDQQRMLQFSAEAPRNPKAYSAAVTHMFGTCRMGSDAEINVVRPDFRHHAVDRLYIADSSIFPTNTGVNPQNSIAALATLCGRRIVNQSST